MLPGIRFLLAAIVLSMSILIFGLGAAALLRAAHEEVANVPTRRVMPEPVFAQQPEAPPPTLAMLRFEPAAPEIEPDMTSVAIASPEPAPEAMPVPEVETEKLAALKADDIATVEAAEPEAVAAAETTLKPETAAEESPSPPPAAEPPPPAETKLAALDAAPSPPAEIAPVPVEQVAPPAITDASDHATIIAALGGPDANVENPAVAKKANEKPDRAEIRRQQRAERARERRRLAARRAKLAAKQMAAQARDPFSQVVQQVQPATTATATTTRHR